MIFVLKVRVCEILMLIVRTCDILVFVGYIWADVRALRCTCVYGTCR